MGHRIAIIADGALQQVGPPQEVYERPANLFVAGFIGTPPMNIIEARGRDAKATALAVGLPGARVPLPEPLARAVAAQDLERRRRSACGPSTSCSPPTGSCRRRSPSSSRSGTSATSCAGSTTARS